MLHRRRQSENISAQQQHRRHSPNHRKQLRGYELVSSLHACTPALLHNCTTTLEYTTLLSRPQTQPSTRTRSMRCRRVAVDRAGGPVYTKTAAAATAAAPLAPPPRTLRSAATRHRASVAGCERFARRTLQTDAGRGVDPYAGWSVSSATARRPRCCCTRSCSRPATCR